MDPGQMLTVLALSGFSGVYIDRNGYPDRAAPLEAQLASLIGEQPIVSSDSRKVFYSIENYLRSVGTVLTPAQLLEIRNDLLEPVQLQWVNTWGHEGDASSGGRWCRKNVELRLTNPSKQIREVKLRMRIDTASNETFHFQFDGPQVRDSIDIVGSGYYERRLELPPGKYTISIHSNTRRLDVPDVRELYFRIAGVELAEGGEIQTTWKGSFSNLERDSRIGTWRWCGRHGILEITNTSTAPRLAYFGMSAQTPFNKPGLLTLTGLLSKIVPIAAKPANLTTVVNVPPGKQEIHFDIAGKRLIAPNDPRELYFRVLDPLITDIAIPFLELN